MAIIRRHIGDNAGVTDSLPLPELVQCYNCQTELQPGTGKQCPDCKAHYCDNCMSPHKVKTERLGLSVCQWEMKVGRRAIKR